MKRARSILLVIQAASVAGTMFFALGSMDVFGKRMLMIPIPGIVEGVVLCAAFSSIGLSFMGALKRAQWGFSLTLVSVLAAAMLAHG